MSYPYGSNDDDDRCTICGHRPGCACPHDCDNDSYGFYDGDEYDYAEAAAYGEDDESYPGLPSPDAE